VRLTIHWSEAASYRTTIEAPEGYDAKKDVQEQSDEVNDAIWDALRNGDSETTRYNGEIELCEVQPQYVATINTPGYLPWDDDPPTFETAREAWQYLAEERQRAEDDAYEPGDAEGFSATANTLETLGTNMNQGTDSDYENAGLDPFERTGTIYGPTPGYDGDHDLGLAYSVSIVKD
jgi:hypothetical protein